MTELVTNDIDCKRQHGKWQCTINGRTIDFTNVRINGAKMETVRRGFRASYRTPATCSTDSGRLKCEVKKNNQPSNWSL